MDPVVAYVGLGSNLDGPEEQLREAVRLLAELDGTRVLHCSSAYASAPVSVAEQPDFVNAVCAVRTHLAPRALLTGLLAIEQRRGRVRGELRDGPRRIDLDLLLYGERVVHEPALEVPHPRMHLRRFVLEPLAEICPQCVVPGQGPVADLLAACADQRVQRLGDSMCVGFV